jgi:nucleotide-binding universal stress UspA family protein
LRGSGEWREPAADCRVRLKFERGGMKRIVVATDFSWRSDRAIRRAAVLAGTFGAEISLVHAIDDDQPNDLIVAAQNVASALLQKQVRNLQEVDGVQAHYRVMLGIPPDGIARAAEEIDADILVVGSHRKASLKDIFVGTTAERTIRMSRLPILTANGEPAGPYRYVLAAVDFSHGTADAVRVAAAYANESRTPLAVVHVYDTPASSLIAGTSLTDDQVEEQRSGEMARAADELDAFMDALKCAGIRKMLRPHETSIADEILAVAGEVAADLVVIGTRGRSGIAKLLLGSVAEEVLRKADRDVLAIPPGRGE